MCTKNNNFPRFGEIDNLLFILFKLNNRKKRASPSTLLFIFIFAKQNNIDILLRDVDDKKKLAEGPVPFVGSFCLIQFNNSYSAINVGECQ